MKRIDFKACGVEAMSGAELKKTEGGCMLIYCAASFCAGALFYLMTR